MHAWGPDLPSLRNLLGQLQSMVSVRDWGGLTGVWQTELAPNPVTHLQGVSPFVLQASSVFICNVETFKLTTPSHIIRLGVTSLGVVSHRGLAGGHT